MRCLTKYLFLLCFCVFLTLNANAQQVQTLGTFKQGADIVLYQTCADCSYNNISFVSQPNLTTIVTEKVMTQSGVTFSYVLSGNYTANNYGQYIVCGYGDPSGTKTTWCYDFYVNGTGRQDPSGAVLTFFIIAFLLVLVFLVWTFVYSLGHAMKKDFDIVDLAFDFGIYFALVGLYLLQQQYVGNPVMDNILYVLFYVGGFTHIFLSSIFFFISMFKASMERSQQQMSGGVR